MQIWRVYGDKVSKKKKKFEKLNLEEKLANNLAQMDQQLEGWGGNLQQNFLPSIVRKYNGLLFRASVHRTRVWV